MPDAYSFAQQADLEIALGGAAVLVQLADWNGDGTADANVVTDFLEDGAAQLRAAAEIKHDPETLANLDTPSLKRLITCNANLSARVAWEKGSRGQAMPEVVSARAEREDRYLERLIDGKARLGRVAGGGQTAVTQAATTGVVDFDPSGCGISVTGFKRGFR